MGLLRVTDQGPGIDPAEATRVFDRFYQGDRSRKGGGTGLGLSIVRAIAEALGGSAEVVVPPRGGVSMVVKLPLAATPAATNKGTSSGPVIFPHLPAGASRAPHAP
jgi:two-component system OmpR family sensor kinase